MIAAIVLAAGASTRMGTLKQLLDFGGQTMLARVVRSLREGGADEVIVVLGHEADRVQTALAGLAVRAVRNPDYETGMFSSIQCGLRAVRQGSEAILVALADQPMVNPGTIRQIIKAHREQRRLLTVPAHGGRGGHPVVLSSRCTHEITMMAPALTLKHFQLAHPDEVAVIEVEDSAVVRDVDNRADYEREVTAMSCVI